MLAQGNGHANRPTARMRLDTVDAGVLDEPLDREFGDQDVESPGIDVNLGSKSIPETVSLNIYVLAHELDLFGEWNQVVVPAGKSPDRATDFLHHLGRLGLTLYVRFHPDRFENIKQEVRVHLALQRVELRLLLSNEQLMVLDLGLVPIPDERLDLPRHDVVVADELPDLIVGLAAHLDRREVLGGDPVHLTTEPAEARGYR